MGFSDLGRKLSKLGQDTKNGVQKMSDSVTISNRISQEKRSLERLFAMIGEAVYKENPDMPKAGLEDEWAAVKVAYANIAAYTEQLNHVKGIVYCPNCGRPAAGGDKFCARCGFKLDAHPETTGAKMAKDLKEAGQEVGRIATDAADKTGEAVGGAAAGTRNAFSWLKGKLAKPKKAEDGAQPEEAAEEAAEERASDGAVTAAGEVQQEPVAEASAGEVQQEPVAEASAGEVPEEPVAEPAVTEVQKAEAAVTEDPEEQETKAAAADTGNVTE